MSVCYCPSVIDGSAIAGLERTAVYEEPEAEKENNKEENDSVLKMLMKKTGKYLIERPVRATITLYPIGRPVRATITLYPIGRPVRATITLYPIGRPVRATITLYPIGRPVRATVTLYPIGRQLLWLLLQDYTVHSIMTTWSMEVTQTMYYWSQRQNM